MKKLLYLFSTGLLVFTSCTNDYDASCFRKDDGNPIKSDTISPPKTDTIPVVIVEPVLLKKLVHTYPNGLTQTIELSYEGNKIVSDKDESNLTFYTYTGDVITKIEKADLSGTYITKEYFYANGKLDYILSKEFGNYYKTKYAYNADGSIISYSRINSDSSGNDGDNTPVSGKYTFSEGKLIRHQINNGSNEAVTTFEYDSKNNPRLNILGFDLLIDMNQLFAFNNVVKKVVTSKNPTATTTVETTYSYEYDANGYPVKMIQTTTSGDTITTESSDFSY